MTDDDELSPEAKIVRHKGPVGEGEFSIGDADLIDDVSAHIEMHVGPAETVFHEIVSTYVHIDVHHVVPSSKHPFHVLVTSGMSQKPMTTPDEISEDRRHAELLICLPAHWPVSQDSFADERHYWPVRWLKILARFPHEYGTWLGDGHTVPNGDPPEPYAPGTLLSGMMVTPPRTFPGALHLLTRANGTTVWFWNLLPLYTEEMSLKLKKGAAHLLERLDRAGIADIVDAERPNVATKRRFWSF